MMKPARGILILLTMALLGASTGSGCGSNASSAQAQPQVVRKKIVAAAKPAAVKAEHETALQPKSAVVETRQSKPAPQKPQPAAAAPPKARPAAAEPGIRPKSEVAATPKPRKTVAAASQAAEKPEKSPETAVNTLAAKEPSSTAEPAGNPVSPKAEPSASGSEKTDAPELAMAVAPEKPGLPPPYDPQDKIDPFEPLFKEEPEMPKRPSDRPKRIPRTPLEKIALSQLKLVGIITAPSGNRALVQEASGKGYIIKKGTYIGTNAGKVVEIDMDKVVVEEEFNDIVGNLQLRKKELLLPKPSGE